jgi:tetratricopeptide (TPR) repeat protein
MSGERADVRDLLNRADRLLRELEYEKALPLLRRAVEIAPRSLDAWRELGTTYGYLYQPEEMGRAFEHALSLAVTPWEEIETWHTRGQAENNCDDWEAALRSFTRLAELDPDWATPWLMRGMVLTNIGNFLDPRYHADALVALDRALALSHLRSVDQRIIYSLKAEALAALDRHEEAALFRRKAEEMRRVERGTPNVPPQTH